MTKSAESNQKDTTKLAKLYAQTLALRALRWKTAKGMAPIITRMLADAKALVALKAELTAGVAAIWDDGAMEQYECTTRMEPRGTFLTTSWRMWGRSRWRGWRTLTSLSKTSRRRCWRSRRRWRHRSCQTSHRR